MGSEMCIRDSTYTIHTHTIHLTLPHTRTNTGLGSLWSVALGRVGFGIDGRHGRQRVSTFFGRLTTHNNFSLSRIHTYTPPHIHHTYTPYTPHPSSYAHKYGAGVVVVGCTGRVGPGVDGRHDRQRFSTFFGRLTTHNYFSLSRIHTYTPPHIHHTCTPYTPHPPSYTHKYGSGVVVVGYTGSCGVWC